MVWVARPEANFFRGWCLTKCLFFSPFPIKGNAIFPRASLMHSSVEQDTGGLRTREKKKQKKKTTKKKKHSKSAILDAPALLGAHSVDKT